MELLRHQDSDTGTDWMKVGFATVVADPSVQFDIYKAENCGNAQFAMPSTGELPTSREDAATPDCAARPSDLAELLKSKNAKVTKAYWFDAILKNHRPVEVSHDLLNEALSALPPIYACGCFGLGEPHSHNERDEPITHWFCERGGRCWCYMGTREEAESAYRGFVVLLGKRLNTPEGIAPAVEA